MKRSAAILLVLGALGCDRTTDVFVNLGGVSDGEGVELRAYQGTRCEELRAQFTEGFAPSRLPSESTLVAGVYPFGTNTFLEGLPPEGTYTILAWGDPLICEMRKFDCVDDVTLVEGMVVELSLPEISPPLEFCSGACTRLPRCAGDAGP